MGCITSGRLKNCNAIKSGGVNELYLADKTEVDAQTIGVNEEVTGFTMAVGGVFYKFEFAADTAQFLEESDNTLGLIVTQTFNQIWYSRNQDQRNILMELFECNCGLVVVHTENTGVSWTWGFDETEEAYLRTATGDSGTAKSDGNQDAPVLIATATKLARTFTGAVPV